MTADGNDTRRAGRATNDSDGDRRRGRDGLEEGRSIGDYAAKRRSYGSASGNDRIRPGDGDRSWIDRRAETVDRRLPTLFVLPALTLVAALVVYPVLAAVGFSLYRVRLLDLELREFVGVSNYLAIASDPQFATVVRNTTVFVGASVVGQVGIGLGLAVLLDRSRLEGWPVRLFRLTYVLPWATTGVIVAFSWRFAFHPQFGSVNAALRGVGVASPPTWLHSVRWAMVAVVVANVWRGLPFSLIFQTSALESVPGRFYEAAAVGGASSLQAIRHVTLPLLRPFLAANVLLVTLFTVNVFDVIYVMTGGGPLHATEVLSLHVYRTAFEVGAFGRANAVAVILFAINGFLVGTYLLVGRTDGGAR